MTLTINPSRLSVVDSECTGLELKTSPGRGPTTTNLELLGP